MITNCATKTITKIGNTNNISIDCVACDAQDGTADKPTVFAAEILDNPKTINAVHGTEGELILTHTDGNERVAEINNKGEMILTLDDDDAEKYSLDSNGNLVYGQ